MSNLMDTDNYVMVNYSGIVVHSGNAYNETANVAGIDTPGLHLETVELDELNDHTSDSLAANVKTGQLDNEAENKTDITIETADGNLFEYDVFENPSILLTIFFAMQQVLMSLSRSLSTSLLVADIVCARSDENYKTRLLSTTMFISGLTTFLQNTIGIRLPLYQGPAATYVIPLLAMSSLPEWRCPDDTTAAVPLFSNATDNTTSGATMDIDNSAMLDLILDRTQKNGQGSHGKIRLIAMLGKHIDWSVASTEFGRRHSILEGSLMIAGGLHMVMGLVGVVGVLLRFIGPITVVPALTVVGLYIYKATTKFAKTQWGVALLVVASSMVLSFYLRKRQSPLPAWTRGRGFHIKWYPAHKMFSVLLSCLIGWAVSAILTVCGALSDDPDNIEHYARTDSRIEVIEKTDWFIFPYPGQFGSPGVDAGALMAFFMGTISSIIDSIGDYYACSKVCYAPPPPNHAVNRGIAVEGFMSFLGGWSGTGHATSTFGGNIGAIGITRVASLRVFQVVGIIFMVFGVVGKIGAIFVTIPYSVIGGMMMINFGVFIGVMLSNLQFIDLSSTRNMAIIGMSMLIALMTPHWIETTPNAINTGIPKLDNMFTMFLANPAFVAGFLACFMDNTIPGTLKERGMLAWQEEMGMQKDDEAGRAASKREIERHENLLQTIYTVPFAKQLLKKFPFLAFIPIYPR